MTTEDLKDRQYQLELTHNELVVISQALLDQQIDRTQLVAENPQLSDELKQRIRWESEMCVSLQERLERLVDDYADEQYDGR